MICVRIGLSFVDVIIRGFGEAAQRHLCRISLKTNIHLLGEMPAQKARLATANVPSVSFLFTASHR